jgi:carbon monoxide dehydrogenase subunit G
MNLLEKIKNLFSKGGIPEEVKNVLADAKTTQQLLTGLDEVLTRNEMEFNKLKKEIDRVVSVLDEEEGKIKEEEDLSGRQKRYTLQYIKRLRSHLDNLDHRMTIFDKNINLHIQLIGKIQDMEAMALRGVDEKQIDDIIMEFEEQVAKYMDVVTAGEAGFEGATSISEREDRELARLEKEIVGETAPAEKEPEAPVTEKEHEAPVAEKKPEEPAPEPEPEEEEEEEDGVMLE